MIVSFEWQQNVNFRVSSSHNICSILFSGQEYHKRSGHAAQRCDVGDIPGSWDHPAHRGGSCQLHVLEGKALSNVLHVLMRHMLWFQQMFRSASPDVRCVFDRTRPSRCGSNSGRSCMRTNRPHAWSFSTSMTTTSWWIWWIMTSRWTAVCGRWLKTCSSCWTPLRPLTMAHCNLTQHTGLSLRFHFNIQVKICSDHNNTRLMPQEKHLPLSFEGRWNRRLLNQF